MVLYYGAMSDELVSHACSPLLLGSMFLADGRQVFILKTEHTNCAYGARKRRA